MNYPFILKFSSISNLTDARYAAGAWSDFIGFCFDPSSDHYIEPKSAKKLLLGLMGLWL
jgi:phosphoribosylanthranilate isomerase